MGVHAWRSQDACGDLPRIERMAGGLASRIITVSEFDRRLALDHGIADEKQIVTVHNGMPDIPAEHRADPGRSPVRLVMVARFSSRRITEHCSMPSADSGNIRGSSISSETDRSNPRSPHSATPLA